MHYTFDLIMWIITSCKSLIFNFNCFESHKQIFLFIYLLINW